MRACGVRCPQGRPGSPAGTWVRTRSQAGAPERHPAMACLRRRAPREGLGASAAGGLEGCVSRGLRIGCSRPVSWGRMSPEEKGREGRSRAHTFPVLRSRGRGSIAVSIYSCDCEDATSISPVGGYERTHGKSVAEGRPACGATCADREGSWSRENNREMNSPETVPGK